MKVKTSMPPIDYEYIHNELSKPGVTLKLLWNEYCIKINDGKYPVSYSKFCRGYTEHVQNHNYTNHIQHKPGIRTEVDWSGPTMHYTGTTSRKSTSQTEISSLIQLLFT